MQSVYEAAGGREGLLRLADALRRADILARAGPPVATMTGRQVD